jgi:hypothetical protein
LKGGSPLGHFTKEPLTRHNSGLAWLQLLAIADEELLRDTGDIREVLGALRGLRLWSQGRRVDFDLRLPDGDGRALKGWSLKEALIRVMKL